MNNKRSNQSQIRLGGLDLGIGGILKGLGDLVEKLEEISESGETLSETGEIGGERGQVKGIYGFTVKVGLDGEKPRVEPFGNLHKDTKSGRTVVQETREPLVDVFLEDDYILVVAEMPGIWAGDIRVEVAADRLGIAGGHRDTEYEK